MRGRVGIAALLGSLQWSRFAIEEDVLEGLESTNLSGVVKGAFSKWKMPDYPKGEGLVEDLVNRLYPKKTVPWEVEKKLGGVLAEGEFTGKVDLSRLQKVFVENGISALEFPCCKNPTLQGLLVRLERRLKIVYFIKALNLALDWVEKQGGRRPVDVDRLVQALAEGRLVTVSYDPMKSMVELRVSEYFALGNERFLVDVTLPHLKYILEKYQVRDVVILTVL